MFCLANQWAASSIEATPRLAATADFRVLDFGFMADFHPDWGTLTQGVRNGKL
jgi:hypothetical protein